MNFRVLERAAVAAVLGALGVAAAGCGGSKPPAVASLGPTTSATTTTSGGRTGNTPPKNGSFVPFATCMNAHGVPVQIAHGGDGVSINGPANGSSNGPPAGFQAAQKACQHLLPGGGPPTLSPAQQAQNLKNLLALAQCMRKHGMPSFPDPNSQGVFQFGPGSSVDPQSQQFQQAMQACQAGKGRMRIAIAVRSPGPGGGGAVKSQASG